MREYFLTRQDGTQILDIEKEKAFMLAATILTMVKITTPQAHDLILSMAVNRRAWGLHEFPPSAWPIDKTLHEALQDIFPSRPSPGVRNDVLIADLTAENLIKKANVRIEGTNDLRDHLTFSPSTGVVKIFHFTGFLREHLYASMDRHSGDQDSTTEVAV